jgi:hypothetical protein
MRERARICTYNGLPASKFGGKLSRALRKGPVPAWLEPAQ